MPAKGWGCSAFGKEPEGPPAEATLLPVFSRDGMAADKIKLETEPEPRKAAETQRHL